MNAEQKRAWFVLSVFALACVGFIALGLNFGFEGAWAAFGVFGLAGFASLIGRREKADERDKAIARRATLGGFAVSYGTFVLGCMGVWTAAFGWRGSDQISVHVLPIITILGGIVLFTVRSVAILILYGRNAEANDA
jgi:hypothetical protein